MKTNIPNEEERKKLQKMAKFNSHLPIYVLCFSSLSLSITFGLKHFTALGTALSVLILAGMIYLILNTALLKRCPRCSSWGTPVTGGNCPKCGLHLDPSDNGDKKHTTQ